MKRKTQCHEGRKRGTVKSKGYSTVQYIEVNGRPNNTSTVQYIRTAVISKLNHSLMFEYTVLCMNDKTGQILKRPAGEKHQYFTTYM